MRTNSTGPRPGAGISTILKDPGVSALWRTLSSDQKTLLLGSRDSLREVTLGDVLQARRVVPEMDAPLVDLPGIRRSGAANHDGCPACSGKGVVHTCFGAAALAHGKAVR